MRSFYTLGIAFLFVLLSACKQDAAPQSESGTQETNSVTTEASGGSQGTPQGQQTPAAAGGHDYTFLTHKILLYKAAFGPKKEGEEMPYKDQWIDLMPDGTFKAGKLKQQTHTGTWTYNHDTKILFLKPNDTTYKMSEWQVMHNEQMLVWVGTQTYGDNAVQIQLAWSDELPGSGE